MNIVVCVKQVPDTSEVKIDPKTNNLVREGVPSIANPGDLNAIELGLSLRDSLGGAVTAVSMGPPQAASVLRQCLEMGVDEAILLSDRAVGGSDTLATGYALSELIRSLSCDLVLCGNEAIDGCTGQVGPIIAGNLGYTQFTYVREVAVSGTALTVLREVGRNIEQYQASLPAVACVLKDINHPRSRSSTDKTPRVVSATDCHLDMERIGNNGSPTRVVKVVMSNARAKTYVDIDDSLSWDERIRMIINGGMERREKVNLWRGTAEELAERLLERDEFGQFLVSV